jgi:hypothetical protein
LPQPHGEKPPFKGKGSKFAMNLGHGIRDESNSTNKEKRCKSANPRPTLAMEASFPFL